MKVLVLCVMLASLTTFAANLQPLTQTAPFFTPVSSGGGDSTQPIISADGRYVAFASTANNLALSNSLPFQTPLATVWNVYLRDRASNTTVLVSANLAGTGGADHDAWPAGISTNGQFVLFESAADNLVAGDTNNAADIFVRDVVNGTTILVSANTNGVCGNAGSSSSVITPDGRYVAFTSAASDLVSSDNNGIPDIFLRDLQGGTTRLVSIGARSTGSTTLPSISDAPAVTPDGRYVAFYSTATNLVSGLKLAGEVYVRDMNGIAAVWASTAARTLFQSVAGTTNAISCNVCISDDGNYIGFEACTNVPSFYSDEGIILRYNRTTTHTDLVCTNAYVPLAPFQNIHNLSMTPDGRFMAFVANSAGTSGVNTAIYEWDALAGTNTVASLNVSNVLSASAYCDAPVVSTNGQYIAFLSSATDLTTNVLAGNYHLYLRNLAAGTTVLLDTDTNGAGSGVDLAAEPVMSADGQTVAFESSQGNLVANDYNHDYDIFASSPGTGTMELVSAGNPLLATTTPNGFNTFSAQPVSQNGRYVAFASDADDVVPGDTNQYPDVFVRDLFTGSNILVSAGINGAGATGISFGPALSSGGRYVAFSSAATNLIPGDANNSVDVFVRDLQAQSNYLVSVDVSGTGEGNNDSYSPTISSDGRYVMFASKASNLAGGSFSGTDNLFVRDLQLGTNYALTTDGWICAAMTPDGHFAAFTDTAGSTAGKIYVWNASTPSRLSTNSVATTLLNVGISSDGGQVAYFAGSSPPNLYLWNRTSNTVSTLAGTSYIGSHPGLRFSANGRFLAYAAASTLTGTNQVYLYDLANKTKVLASHTASSITVSANDSSDSPDISTDGRYVAYRSNASDLVPGDTNGVPDIFLFDSATGSNTILSASVLGPVAANNRSLAPVFSGDGHTLVFRSWASDLASGDYNQTSDLFGFAFLYTTITTANGAGMTINWTVSPNDTYTVEYKDNLTDSIWQTLTGPVTVVGNQGYLTDSSPAASHRFYRVVAGN